MPNIIDVIKSFVINFANNENYINIISIIIVALTTHHVTKYTTLKPERMKIKQAQLEDVYLPLFLLLNNVPANVTKSQALIYCKRISNVLDKHYLLAFPQLHRLNHLLKSEILSDKNYVKTLFTIKHQVEIDYELLKKVLGYPSENFPDIFIRMTFKQKCICIYPWLDACWLFIPCIVAFVFYDFFGKYLIPVLILLLFSGLFVMNKLNRYINSSDN